jgi:phage shock protein A
MKLLTMRQRDFRVRNFRGAKRREKAPLAEPTNNAEGNEAVAPVNEEVESITFFLDKAIEETVAYASLKDEYEERVAEYSESMRSMVTAVKALGSEMSDFEKQELELTIEQCELKVELASSTLEQLRDKLARLESGGGDSEDRNEATRLMIQNKDAPILRTVLVSLMNKCAEAEVRHD